MLLYSMLYLTGFGLELTDIENFRSWASLTPGHPEYRHTDGVEITTGPLGQGFANAVGMAFDEAHNGARFGSDVCDHHIFGICSDGDLMEGISHEAASLAGHYRLGRMVFVYDDNHITIDGPTRASRTPTTSRCASPRTAGMSSRSARSPTTSTPSSGRSAKASPRTGTRR